MSPPWKGFVVSAFYLIFFFCLLPYSILDRLTSLECSPNTNLLIKLLDVFSCWLCMADQLSKLLHLLSSMFDLFHLLLDVYRRPPSQLGPWSHSWSPPCSCVLPWSDRRGTAASSQCHRSHQFFIFPRFFLWPCEHTPKIWNFCWLVFICFIYLMLLCDCWNQQ